MTTISSRVLTNRDQPGNDYGPVTSIRGDDDFKGKRLKLDGATAVRDLEAEIGYTAEISHVNRLFVSPGRGVAADAHGDMMPDRAERLAADNCRQHPPDQRPFSRLITASVWRCFSTPPQDMPLAVCEAGSVADGEGLPSTLIVVDTIPDEPARLGRYPGEEALLAAVTFRHNDRHRSWNYADMTRDEALVFKFHDSDPRRATRVPHLAFRDPSASADAVRDNIELRSVAYFEGGAT